MKNALLLIFRFVSFAVLPFAGLATSKEPFLAPGSTNSPTVCALPSTAD
jgi:hypothetical protein